MAMQDFDLETGKKQIYELMCNELYVPMKRKELAALLQVPRERRDDLQQVLDALLLEGKIQVSGHGKYSKTEGDVIVGTFSGTQKGYGFVVVDGMADDIFIPENKTNGAMNKDVVSVAISKEKTGKRREGTIVKIITHGYKEVVGRFEKNKRFGFVVVDDQKFSKDIYIPLERSKGAVTGHKVLVEITDFGGNNKKPEGKVLEILGHENDPGVDIISIIKGFGIKTEFPKEVMDYVADIPDEVSGKDIAGRVDLRNVTMVTIDGEDAKDLDDAVSVEKSGKNYKLGVHIADVSNYVKENSVLDKEALLRGTSNYLVDRVIPMLPHKLSNGICSLNAGCDRLALSCIMQIDEKGNIIDHKIAETVICIDERMSYTSVKKILVDNDKEECERYEKLIPMFKLMEELAAILRKKRMARGAIDFDFPECKVILDEDGKPLDIKPYERNVATKIIEEFMLAANETVAEDYFWQELPFVYRTHDNPDSEKIMKLSTFINNFGYAIKLKQDDEIHPKELQKLLNKIEGTKEEMLISRLTLRSMKQARYTTECSGHFGLASRYYCHFTSPIRRYPDLQIHRIIKENIHGKMQERRVEHYDRILPGVAKHSSEMERRADEAERETNKLKKAEYMKYRLGIVYEGVISSITTWGMYVELPNTIEGLVRVTSLTDDYYYYDEEHYEMRAEHINKVYKLGQKVKVTAVNVDLNLRTIDFELVEVEEEAESEQTASDSQTTNL